MKKPTVITVLGWMCLGFLSASMIVPLAQAFSGIHLRPTIWPGLVLAASVPCFVLWVIGSIWHGINAHKARMYAQQLGQLRQEQDLASRLPKVGGMPK